MKMKLLAAVIILFSAIIFADGVSVEVTDEDIDSPLMSYLLAKVQRLEAKMMAKPNVRNTREIEKRSVNTNTSADDKKDKGCPQVVTYIRWGNTTCPYGSNTIYQGTAVGGQYKHKGSPSNLMCLPPNPMHYSSNPGGNTWVYAVEYRTSGNLNHANNRNMPCALCEATGRGDKIMIPSHYVCPDGWHKEYNGYIMAGYYTQEGSSMHYCVDGNLEQIIGSGDAEDVHLLYTVRAYGPHVPKDGYPLTCVVCTK